MLLRHRTGGFLATFLLSLTAIGLLSGFTMISSGSDSPPDLAVFESFEIDSNPDYCVFDQTFVRNRGRYTIESEIINTEGSTGPYELTIATNSPHRGKYKMTVAWVWLDGELIYRPFGFRTRSGEITLEVDVQNGSTIEVLLLGRRGASVTIKVFGTMVSTSEPVPTSIEITPSIMYLSINPFSSYPAKATVSAIVYDDAGEEIQGAEVEWSSDNPTVLSVDYDGLVAAIAPGSGGRVIASYEVWVDGELIGVIDSSIEVIVY